MATDEGIEHADGAPDLQALVAECLQQLESGAGETGAVIEAVCAPRPALTDAVRAAVERILALGLIDSAKREKDFPSHLGDYRLVKQLGQGGMGVVYIAEQQKLGRTIALKLIRPDQTYFDGARARLLREVSAAAKLSHPNIVSVFDVGEENGVPYFAMEHIVGCSLAEILERLRGSDPHTLRGEDARAAICAVTGTQLEREGSDSDASRLFDGTYVQFCVRTVRQVAAALAHAHGRQIIHRDIKPSNIMLTATGRVVLVDFGLAHHESDARLTRSGAALGSLAYMAPEQVRCERADERSDVYGLGVTAFELLTLRPAFESDSAHAIQMRIVTTGVPALRTISRGFAADLEVVIGTACGIDSSARYSTANALLDDLTNLLEMRPITARAPRATTRLHRWVQRHRPQTVAIVLATLVLIGTPLLWLWSNAREAAAKQLADQSFEQAQVFVEQMLERINDQSLTSLPGSSELSKRLMTDVLAEYTRLGELRKDDYPTIRRAARLHADFALTFDSFQALDEAERASREGLALIKQLPVRTRVDALIELTCWNVLVHSGFIRSRHESALELIAEARPRFESAIVDFPEEPRIAAKFARFHLHTSHILSALNRREDGEAAIQHGLEIADSLDASNPEVMCIRGDLHYERGFRAFAAREHTEAARHLGQAAQWHRRVLEAQPNNASWQQRVAKTAGALGSVLRNRADAEGAELAMTDSLESWTKLVARFPNRVMYASSLAGIQNNMATLRMDQGRFDEALRLVTSAIEHQTKAHETSPDNREISRFLSSHNLIRSLVDIRQGRHKDLDAFLQRAVELNPHAMVKFDAARMSARRRVNAEADKELSDGERAELVQDYTDSGVSYLRSAVEAGFKRLDLLDRDHWLKVFAGESEFQAIRAKLQPRK